MKPMVYGNCSEYIGVAWKTRNVALIIPFWAFFHIVLHVNEFNFVIIVSPFDMNLLFCGRKELNQ